MNFCGGAIEHQVHEPPIVSMPMNIIRNSHNSSFDEDDNGAASGAHYHHHVDRLVASSKPQSKGSTSCSSSSRINSSTNDFLKLTKQKLHKSLQQSTTSKSSEQRQDQHAMESSSTTAVKGTRSHHHHSSSTSNPPPPTSKTSSSKKTSPSRRSRSRSRSQSRDKSLEERMSGMEIVAPSRQTTTKDNNSSPRKERETKEPPTTTTTASATTASSTAATSSTENSYSSSIIGLPSFANMKTLDTLLKRLENGFRVTIHNGSDPSGRRVFLTLLQNRTSLMIRPIVEGEDGKTPSVKFPVQTILRLEIGKTKSSVLGRTIYDHIHPMTCFSIVVKLWNDEETYFDFEASSVIEREALISTLMVVLDQMHNNKASNNNEDNTNEDNTSSPIGSPAWLCARKGSVENAAILSDNDKKKTSVAAEEEEAVVVDSPPPGAEVCLSPGKRTKIYSSTFFDEEADGDDQQGTEISLVYTKHETRSPKASKKHSRPLRQRQLQPAAEEAESHLASPPRTSRFRSSPGNKLNPFLPSPVTKIPLSLFSKSPRTCNYNDQQAPKGTTPKDQPNGQQQQEQETPENDGIVILDANNNPGHPADEIEINLGSPEATARADISFDIARQGLPVSKIQFTPTRDNFDPQSGCCNLAPPNMDGGINPAWCSDDICTLALKDIAETCTGMFDQRHRDFPSDPNGDFRDVDPNNEADRAYIEEYIACSLGGPNGALGAIFPDGDVWNVDSSKGKGGRGKVKAIRNRASLLNAQATRLRTLRNEMTFAAALKRSKEKMQYVQTTKSFDDADGELIRRAQERSVSRLHSSALMERVMGGMVLSSPEADEDSLYYDSDPEDARARTKGVRRALANHRNAVSKEDEHKHQARPVLSGVGFERIAVSKKLRKLDEGLIVQIVQAMRNETLTLMWHPTQSAQFPNRSPVCVNLWIESGVYLVDGSFLLPRLSWSVAYENDLGAKRLNVSKAEPDQIDLLDVCRIRVTEKIDRKLHPFPDPRKSFIVETQEETYLFEAQGTDERNRIVYGYKLVIARLASLLMLRDSRAVEEFFGSASAMVPGGFTVGK